MQQVFVGVTMVSAVLRVMGNVSVLTLTRPKQVLNETKRMIYSKPPRNKIGAAVSLRIPTDIFNFFYIVN